MKTGAILRQLRNAKGYGIRDLERLTGINRGNLSKIERGSGFGPSQIKRIAEQLDTTPAVIFILSEILSDGNEILDDSLKLHGLCLNLTNLLKAFQQSPNEMQAQIEELLSDNSSVRIAAS